MPLLARHTLGKAPAEPSAEVAGARLEVDGPCRGMRDEDKTTNIGPIYATHMTHIGGGGGIRIRLSVLGLIPFPFSVHLIITNVQSHVKKARVLITCFNHVLFGRVIWTRTVDVGYFAR